MYHARCNRMLQLIFYIYYRGWTNLLLSLDLEHEDRHKAKKMVNFCAVIGCGNRWNRDKWKSLYCLPAIITGQGVQTQTLSEKDGWVG